MARRKYTEEDFPPAGTVLQMPLADGRLGLCRVLRVGSDFGDAAAIVVASSWIGDSPPELTSDAVRDTLHLTHHSWNGKPQRTWVSEPPPDSFVVLGKVELSDEEQLANSNSFSGWQTLPLQVLTQWRWENDRENLDREDREKATKERAERLERKRARDEYLNTVTLEELSEKELFPRWDDYPSAKAQEGTKRIMKGFISELQASTLGGDAEIREGIKRSVQELNQLDQSNDHFIETVERADLYDVFEEILSAAKAPHLLDAIDEWRDW